MCGSNASGPTTNARWGRHSLSVETAIRTLTEMHEAWIVHARYVVLLRPLRNELYVDLFEIYSYVNDTLVELSKALVKMLYLFLNYAFFLSV